MLARILASLADPGIALDAAVVRRHDRAMNVEAINIGPSDAIAPVQAASTLAGKGLQLNVPPAQPLRQRPQPRHNG
jgi:hypothetical protein